ncbi:MAG: hypothetical protein LBC68_08085 [Prevotellaceae bacterium]|jgi:hypothetical protein|nr:hypothetical protein [Prevotellaceae bacterium]
MSVANLINEKQEFITGNDNVVIVDNFQSIRGGRTLDVTGVIPNVINAGHVIIKETATGNYKPMPVSKEDAIATLGTVTGGSGYTAGTYNGVALQGGSGSGATANITVASGVVTGVTIVNAGTGYKAGDTLTAPIAGGSGFSVPVATTAPSQYEALPAGHAYAGILIASILTKRPFAGIMVRGTVNSAAAPYPMSGILAAVKAALPLIDFRED